MAKGKKVYIQGDRSKRGFFKQEISIKYIINGVPLNFTNIHKD